MRCLPSKEQCPLVMGIINITPDSFSGDGLYAQDDFVRAAVRKAKQMAADGADILDIGGESTRPGSVPTSIDEETSRVLPVLVSIREALPQIILSIDTMKPAVAHAAIMAGATIINDVSGAEQDPQMLCLAAQTGAYLVLMHNDAKADNFAREQTIGGEYHAPSQEKTVATMVQEVRFMAEKAKAAGIADDKLIVDPGIGFGKTLEQNLALILELDAFASLRFPILLAASRKSFIGRVLDAPPEDRLEGTAAAVGLGVLKGASILRVHDVRFMARYIRMMHALRFA